MRQLLFLAFFGFFSFSARATHLLGGEITAKNISGLTYEISGIVYFDMEGGAAGAISQTDLLICLGDGTQLTAARVSFDQLDGNAKVNRGVYRVTHTYGSAGTYTIMARLDQFTLGILNLTNPGQSKYMAIRTILNTAQPNSTAPAPGPVFVSGLRQVFSLPLPRTDPDGDSLTYRIVKPLDQPKDCEPAVAVDRYLFPNEIRKEGTFLINFQTANLLWSAPTETGLYAYAYVTEEWRKGVKITESWRTYVVMIRDLTGATVPVPPYEPVLVGFNGIITALPPQEFLPGDALLKVYPNPSADYITVEIGERQPTPTLIELIDLRGRVLQRAEFEENSADRNQTFKTSDLAKGVYLIRVHSKDAVVTRKFVR